jgi:hypothetical protein
MHAHHGKGTKLAVLHLLLGNSDAMQETYTIPTPTTTVSRQHRPWREPSAQPAILHQAYEGDNQQLGYLVECHWVEHE